MKKVVVCYKWVVDEADIRVDESSQSLDFDRVKNKISDYDLNAIEVGAQLAEQEDWEFVAATCGCQVEASLKDVLSRGASNIYYVNDEVLAETDSCAVSKVLSTMIQKIGDVDLVICGEGSCDEYAQQVGPRIAALLGVPSCTYVNKLDFEGNKLVAERKLENGVEVVTATGPVVVTVLPDINSPRIPSLKQILGAKKKPVTNLTLQELGMDVAELQAKEKVISIRGAVMERKCIKMNADGVSVTDAAQKLAQQLYADGVIG